MRSFISTTKTVAGWKAAVFIFDDENGCYWPDEVAYFGYEDESKAIQEAIFWAEADGLEYKARAM